MKFITSLVVVASSLAAMATADMLQISNPTQGTTWTVGKAERLEWGGNCAVMGAAGQNVTVDFVTGPSTAVRYVATLGQINCSGSTNRADLKVPDLTAGDYALIINTAPDKSYTNSFKVLNPSSAPPPAASPVTTTGATASPTSTPGKSAAGSLSSNAMWAVAGAAAVAYQLL
ncbi:hypothetical protein EDD11_006882 [Mortierella claussenii]|nr:hypothetical protein EDD11_006882 [Mortierella claussenii]